MLNNYKVPGFVSAVLGLLMITPLSLLQAQDLSIYNGTLGGARVIEEGQPPVFIFPTVEDAARLRLANGSTAASTGNMTYHGGTGGIGVETAPKVYLVLYGSQWSNDPSGESQLLQSFFQGVGGSQWFTSVTQYCQGVASGTTFCNGAGQAAGNQPNMFAGFWADNASAVSRRPSQSALAAEAQKAAAHFGNTTAASNASVQYVIALPTGISPSGFKTSYCAYHSSVSGSAGTIAWTNLPYITDAGSSCGANFNGLGPNAGITIVEGHEMGETVTDQFPSSGWIDASGAENGDKCAWIATGSQGASAKTTFTSGTFPVQSLWSNSMNGNAGGCYIP